MSLKISLFVDKEVGSRKGDAMYTFNKEQLEDLLIRAIEEYIFLSDGMKPSVEHRVQAVDRVVEWVDRRAVTLNSETTPDLSIVDKA